VVAAQGVALESDGQTQQAIAVFNQLLNLDPNNALAKKRLSVLTNAPQKPSTKSCD
jgi:Flp pilus assembly protein TadD